MTTVPTALTAAVIYGVIGATMANLAAIYIFHITDPATMSEIETGILEDTLQAESMKQAQANIEAQSLQLGAILAARATGKLKYRLNLPMGEHESSQVIDVKSTDITPTQAPQKNPANLQGKVNPVAKWIMSTAKKITRPAPAMARPVQVYEQTAPQPIAQTDKKPLPEIKRGAPILFEAKIDGGRNYKTGDMLQAVLCEDGLYNLSLPDAIYAFARITAEELEIIRNGEQPANPTQPGPGDSQKNIGRK